MDISKEMLNFAEKGIYAPNTSELVGASIFERLTAHDKREMFDWEGDQAKVKSWLREGITWRLGDAADPELIRSLGPQDMVVANNFLCHMAPADAEKCLRNIGQLVSPGGYLFVSGVDLDVRTKVALDLGWEPVTELMAEIHDGDPSVRADWPWQWWGLEPLNRRRHDWQTRYAAAFRIVVRKPMIQSESRNSNWDSRICKASLPMVHNVRLQRLLHAHFRELRVVVAVERLVRRAGRLASVIAILRERRQLLRKESMSDRQYNGKRTNANIIRAEKRSSICLVICAPLFWSSG